MAVRSRALIISVLLVIGVPHAAAQAASEATPASAATETACRIAPRTIDELVALTEGAPGSWQSRFLGTPVATPPPPSGGVPADQRVVDAVGATVWEQIACINAGDLMRAAALWSDDYIRHSLGGLPEEALVSLSTPTPLPEVDRAILQMVDEVRLLDDGRFTAVVTTTDATSLVVFVESDGRYLIDDSIVLSRHGTPTT